VNIKQKIIDKLYRYPKAALKKNIRFGGYFSFRKMMRNSRLMESTATGLDPIQSYTDGLPVYFLTGERYLFQTLYCIQSLAKVTNTKFNFKLVDDGSFNDQIIEIIQRSLPFAEIIDRTAIEKNLYRTLPPQEFNNLYEKRKVYPHIKKLMDIHTLPGNNWKLVLDSDMLFWSEPALMIDWLKHPDKPLYMTDCQTSYGYSYELMSGLAETSIADLINVGVVGLNSSQIDWRKINQWVQILEETEGTSYYLEQALTAMLIGETDAVILPADTYIVNPDETAIINRTGILHHYVDLSKKGYYNTAWRMIDSK
jgi:hypothetical protein